MSEKNDQQPYGLAPYAMRSERSRGRQYPEPEHPGRNFFQRDRDRVIHCQAFRRLMYKTQVFVTHEGDYFRTRLTHTLEVAQIARTIARMLGLNEDLVEAIALAHDVGHTPFGHSGEDALNELMAGHGGFEHNRHGLRVVDVLEKRYPDFTGLNLTYEVRESIAKHTTRHDKPAAGAFDDGLMPVLEGQIVEMADSIAYDSHDLDDALRTDIASPEDFRDVEIWRQAEAEVRTRYPVIDRADVPTQVVRFLINRVVLDLVATSRGLIEAEGIRSVDDVRKAPRRLIAFSSELSSRLDQLEECLMAKVYRHWRVMRMTGKAKRIVKGLFEAYLEDTQQLPPHYTGRLAADGPQRVIADYVAGMTDRYAQDEYKKLFFPFERV